MSGTSFTVGRFSGDYHWPVLGDYRGWHLSYTHRGKGHTQYIRDAFVPQVKAEVSNFKRFRKLIDRLITLSIERSQLRMKMEQNQ